MADTITVSTSGPAADGTTRISTTDRRREAPKATIEVAGSGAAPRRVVRRPARGREADAGLEDSRVAALDAGKSAAERRASTAETAAAAARAETGRAVATLVTERVTSAQNSLDAATSAKNMALSQLRSAREAGDFEAEQSAIDAISQSNVAISNAESALATAKNDQERLKAAPRPDQQTDPNEPSPASKAWIAAHPMVDTDDDYFASAASADALAVRRGHQRGTQAYVEFVDKRLEEEYGPGHGNPATHGRESRTDDHYDDEAASFLGAPRGGGRGRGVSESDDGRMIAGGEQVRTELGVIGYRMGRDGQPVISFPNESVKQDFETGAQACNMSLGEYALEMVSIARDQAAGRPTGLYREEEAVTHR